ncbi:MAG TPA: NADPH:quinone oxidoreductase family protein [Mycobacteriales bacterium]|nr:NADPH:quinone oxidoreductase family protein [Mycobacteriales bacterium]
MRAIRCEMYGPPSDLVLRELPDPEPAAGEVVIGIEGAAVNFPDSLFIQNRYQISVPVPFTPGSEFAGTVLAVAPDVTSVKVGDRVMGGAMTGAYAEKIAVPAAAVIPVPAGLDGPAAAAFQVTFRTAYHGLTTIGGLQPGRWVVVLGAAGGVGTAGVDIAVRLGAKVIAVDRGADRLERCRELGAEAIIDTDQEDLKARIKEVTGAGADLVIDPVGGDASEQALRSTAWGGRFVVIGFAAGDIPKIPLNLVLLKGVIIRGFEIRTLPDLLPDAYAAGEKELARMVGEGLRPLVAEVFPLARTADAMNAILERKVTGKVVIDPTC